MSKKWGPPFTNEELGGIINSELWDEICQELTVDKHGHINTEVDRDCCVRCGDPADDVYFSPTGEEILMCWDCAGAT